MCCKKGSDDLGKDKELHVLCGFAICVFVGLIFNSNIGLLVSCLAGIGKEVYDYFHPKQHSVELADFIATMFGGVVGFLILNYIVY